MMSDSDFTTLSDDRLITEIKRLVSNERHATVAVVRSLAEIDARRLYLREGSPSLFAYCTQVLHLAEGAAYNRIQAARAARRFPAILDRLGTGEVTLTSVRLLAPHLTDSNVVHTLELAKHRPKREVEALVASLHPRPDLASAVRKLPSHTNEAPTPVMSLGAFEQRRAHNQYEAMLFFGVHSLVREEAGAWFLHDIQQEHSPIRDASHPHRLTNDTISGDRIQTLSMIG